MHTEATRLLRQMIAKGLDDLLHAWRQADLVVDLPMGDRAWFEFLHDDGTVTRGAYVTLMNGMILPSGAPAYMSDDQLTAEPSRTLIERSAASFVGIVRREMQQSHEQGNVLYLGWRMLPEVRRHSEGDVGGERWHTYGRICAFVAPRVYKLPDTFASTKPFRLIDPEVTETAKPREHDMGAGPACRHCFARYEFVQDGFAPSCERFARLVECVDPRKSVREFMQELTAYMDDARIKARWFDLMRREVGHAYGRRLEARRCPPGPSPALTRKRVEWEHGQEIEFRVDTSKWVGTPGLTVESIDRTIKAINAMLVERGWAEITEPDRSHEPGFYFDTFKMLARSKKRAANAKEHAAASVAHEPVCHANALGNAMSTPLPHDFALHERVMPPRFEP